MCDICNVRIVIMLECCGKVNTNIGKKRRKKRKK